MLRSNEVAWLGVGVFVAACAGGAKAPVAAAPCTLPVQVRLEASERINPNEHGIALPTSIRVYRLRQIARLEESDFAAVWETPKEALSEDLLGVQDFTLFPSGIEQAQVSLEPDARFLVGVAIFRQPTGTQWRAILPLPPSQELCAAYAPKGPPMPAVTFRFDQYRVESRSRLLVEQGELDLPRDVAPENTSGSERQP